MSHRCSRRHLFRRRENISSIRIEMELNEFANEDEDFQNFLRQATTQKNSEKQNLSTNSVDERIAVRPEPGFCLKTKRIFDESSTTKTEKVFINVCTSSLIQPPREVTEEELIEIVQSEDPGRFRVPISLGEPVADLDKNGQACVIFTVIVHPDFYNRTQSSTTFMNFLLTLIYEGLENKYPQFKFDTDWTKLKNRKYMGQLTEQFIRARSKPFIVEVDQQEKVLTQSTENLESESNVNRGSTPEFKIVREPIEGDPEFLIMEVQLPNVKSSKTLTLDIGPDHIILSTRSNIYHLDIWLPIEVDPDESGGQFDRATQILTVTMPVQQNKTSNQN